ncbi:uncharacterized protein LOC103373985 [Stegastes partitus]|uniref:Uncharacterized protein LOC103373985 n=1 Tax=Stegastes partitus TaxID=144197 RepID=A0A9Y4NRL0_9TELE|nr:PREDICTED: uncharacterized protein LOC103373985 [Stegastes partitus]
MESQSSPIMEGLNGEDSTSGLCCEEAEVPPSAPCSACNDDRQQTDTGDKASCPHVETTVYNISGDLVSQHLDTPTDEEEEYVVITIVKEATDTSSSALINVGPEGHNSFQTPEEMQDEIMDACVELTAHTKTHLESLLQDLGLEQRYKEKLSLSNILEIDEKTITGEPAKSKSDLPWHFLKQLMMVNVTARNVKCTSVQDSNCNAASGSKKLNLKNLVISPNSADMVNPLDIITALFLCSDGFVQQEMALKMSMCQFSVPLLLPNCDTKQCMLMLWAMRDIVKKYRPQSLSESKGFTEERIVLSEIPMISFVRLGECSLSKSEILNKILSNSQQYHDTFVHHDMECGDSPRRISNGLTEITWYLPCGSKTLDVFSQPVAVANLRGDIASFETQFSFLCQTSAAVFVFFDNLDSECSLLTNKNHKAQIFLVGNHQSKSFSLDALGKVATRLGLTNNNIILKTKNTNDADFVRSLRKSVSDVVENSKMKMPIVQMADIAHELGILVDEDSPECQAGKQKADAITDKIQDILRYKEDQLPLQGQIWKDLTSLEKEEFRLRKAGSENIEIYKSDLQVQKGELRKRQNSYEMSPAMTCFIAAVSSPGIERCYFLKWMRMNLDNVSRLKLSGLREQYKEKCKNSDNKAEIKEIDRQLSNSSLGTEHFLREMGQIYEASVSLPETDPRRQQLQHLPKLCAKLLLDGFPLELVDGGMTSLWNAVKHENFIFSFRNSLVADAYMRLCTEFNKWEWEFRKDMYTWVTNAETEISNFGTVGAKSQTSDMDTFLTQLKSEATTELSKWETKLLNNLTQYFKQTEGHVYLVEGYKEEFSNSAKSLRQEMKSSVVNQLTAAADIRRGMRELDRIKENHTNEIEKAVCALIDECRKRKVQMGETELDKEFDKMWNETLKKLPFSEQQTTDVFTRVDHCLRANLSHKGSGACELLSQKRLQDCGQEPFTCTNECQKKFKHEEKKLWYGKDHVQEMADSIIAACTQFVTEKIQRKNNYHDTYIQELLLIIDESLENNQNVKTDIEFEVSLKQHICGFAAKRFEEMHKNFIQENDPHRCLMKNKERFRSDFKDVFHKRDQGQKKAEEFTDQCLKPAVEEFVNRSLGPNIVDEMLKHEEFSTRMSFQCSLLKDLLSKKKLEDYLNFSSSYEHYVKNRILQQIEERFPSSSATFKYEDQHLKSSISNINDAIAKAKTGNCVNLKAFVEDICKELGNKKLVISQTALDTVMTLNNADKDSFARWLTVSVNDMAETLREKFKKMTIAEKLNHLHMKPQNELFTRVIGCGKQCPFCAVPCDAGGKAHTEHFASLHWPEGLGKCRWDSTKKLVTDICSSLVISDVKFCCDATNNEPYPYKRYKEIFPDWDIRPDVSLEASNYWKYVMATYNTDFAKAYGVEPADIPATWKTITYKQAEDSLNESFGTK